MDSNEFRVCPYCAEKIKAEAIKCKHCLTFLNDNSAVRTLSDLPQKETTTTVHSTGEKLEKAGKTMQSIGCLLTLFVTIPILLIFIFLIGGC